MSLSTTIPSTSGSKPTGSHYHTCPSCKKYGTEVHISQGTPHPEWKCANETGEPYCVICNQCLYVVEGNSDGWFCKEHKLKKPITAERARQREDAIQHHRRLISKSKAMLGVKYDGKKIKKTILQIKVIEPRASISAWNHELRLSEWNFNVTPHKDAEENSAQLKGLLNKLHRNATVPGGVKSPSTSTKRLMDVLQELCTQASLTSTTLPEDVVVIDSMFVSL